MKRNMQRRPYTHLKLLLLKDLFGERMRDLHGERDERDHEEGPGHQEAADDEGQVHVVVRTGHLTVGGSGIVQLFSYLVVLQLIS
jgi:hypothetical protein